MSRDIEIKTGETWIMVKLKHSSRKNFWAFAIAIWYLISLIFIEHQRKKILSQFPNFHTISMRRCSDTRVNRNSRTYIDLIPSLAQWQRTGPGVVLTVLISRDLHLHHLQLKLKPRTPETPLCARSTMCKVALQSVPD